MKKYFLFVIIACILISCSDNEDSEVIRAAVPSNTLWKYKLGNYPSEGSLLIVTQPMHSILNEISIDTTEGGVSYYYMSEKGFTGTENISIERTSSKGDDEFDVFTYFIELEVN